VPDLDPGVDEFHTALGIKWRAPTDAVVPRLGADGVVELNVDSIYSEAGPPIGLSSLSPERRSRATVA
jgi:hypothetical protein